MSHPEEKAGSELAALSRPEPAFRLTSSCHLGIDADDDAAANYLARRVAAFPKDLLSHARRVLLAQRQGNAEALFGALVDLFIATGRKGIDLRRSLLAAAETHLASEQFAYLQAHLADGLPANAPLTGNASLLSTGAVGTVNMIVRSAEA